MLGARPPLRAIPLHSPLVVGVGNHRSAPRPAGRLCPCGNVLSRYNVTAHCHACQVAERQRREEAVRLEEERQRDRQALRDRRVAA